MSNIITYISSTSETHMKAKISILRCLTNQVTKTMLQAYKLESDACDI